MVEKSSRERTVEPHHHRPHILQPEIFDILAAEKRRAGNEIQLTDAMIELARTQPF